MILIHGECGSGKSAALRALESAPPAGVRAVYVPVPTLDFGDLARWCVERLRLGSGEPPAVALREHARRAQIALLIDDADLLPLETALAIRQLERDAAGNLAVVAACESEARETAAIVALGEVSRALAMTSDDSAAVAAQVSAALFAKPAPALIRTTARGASARLAGTQAPAVRLGSAASASAPATVSATRREPAPAQSPASPPAAAAPARSEAAPIAAAPARPKSAPRSVPLALAVAMAAAAFLVPVAFMAGYLLGTGPRDDGARAASPAKRDLPAVAAAPPQVSAPEERAEPAAAAPRATLALSTPATARTAVSPSAIAPAAPEIVAAEPVAATAAPELQPRRTAEARRRPQGAAPPGAERLDSVQAEPAPAEPRRAEGGWGAAPALISVEPGDGP